jgi:hypothetical protein
MVCRPATSEAGARRPAGAINCIWTTYLGNYHNCSTLGPKVISDDSLDCMLILLHNVAAK